MNAYGKRGDLARELGVTESSLSQLLTRDKDPSISKLLNICAITDVSLEYIMFGHESGDILTAMQEGTISLKIHDIEVEAGDGAVVPSFEKAYKDGEMPFPAQWLRREFGDITKLRLVKVRGESMVPVLSDGDLIMIHVGQTDIVSGIAVVRQADQLQVKRLVRDGNNVILQSDNPAYPTVIIDLSDDAKRDGFEVIGRVVWTGRKV